MTPSEELNAIARAIGVAHAEEPWETLPLATRHALIETASDVLLGLDLTGYRIVDADAYDALVGLTAAIVTE